MPRLIAFVLAVSFMAVLSRKTLSRPKAHGFWRFFAFVAIVAQLLLAFPFWLVKPFSWHQLVSWPLLAISLVLVIVGFRWLRKIGGSGQREPEPANFAFENTGRLVTTGPYRWIRHPMYSSLLFLSWGAFFKRPALAELALALLTSCFLWQTARVEERENIAVFGAAYEAYVKSSKMFVPCLF